jgi:hypothetical protein
MLTLASQRHGVICQSAQTKSSKKLLVRAVSDYGANKVTEAVREVSNPRSTAAIPTNYLSNDLIQAGMADVGRVRDFLKASYTLSDEARTRICLCSLAEHNIEVSIEFDYFLEV